MIIHPEERGLRVSAESGWGGRADGPLLVDVWHAMLTSIPYISCILVLFGSLALSLFCCLPDHQICH